MTVTQAMVWFVITALAVVALLAFGMWEGTHSYSRKHHDGTPQH